MELFYLFYLRFIAKLKRLIYNTRGDILKYFVKVFKMNKKVVNLIMPRASSEPSSLGMNLDTLLRNFINNAGITNHAVSGDWKKLGLIDKDTSQPTPLGMEIRNNKSENNISIPYMVIFYSLDGKRFPFLEFFQWLYDQIIKNHTNEITITLEQIGNFLKTQGYFLGTSSEEVRLRYIRSYIVESLNKNYKLSKLLPLSRETSKEITIEINEAGLKFLAFLKNVQPKFNSYKDYLKIITQGYSLRKILTLLGKIEQ